MEKVRGKHDIWIIVIIVAGLGAALLITSIGIRNQSLIRGLEAQVEEQAGQIEQMTHDLEQCEEVNRAHKVERDIFDDIINNRLPLSTGLMHLSDPIK